LLAFAALLFVAQERGYWQAGNLLGTAGWEARPPDLLQRVSLSRLGIEGNSDSFAPSVSADGQRVVFLSSADNLVEGDHNGYHDVFWYERSDGQISRLSVGVDGQEANGASSDAHISADGRFVVFVSEASNLVSGDTNGYEDVFLYDRQTGVTNIVSVAADGTQGDNRSLQPAISADGRFVAFVSLADSLADGDENGMSDIYVYSRETGRLELVSVASDGSAADDTSKHPAISADGRYVAFQSKATNLAEDDRNNMYDIFLRDRQAGVTELISRNTEGRVGNMESQRPSISANGRFVAFESWASDLVVGDENYWSDVFVADQETGVMEMVSVSSAGQQADDVNGGAVISADGRYVAFASLAGNLVPNDRNEMFDVYLHDRDEKSTRLISVNVNGWAGSGPSISPSLTSAGNYIVFDSVATDLVLNDKNERVDVFVFNAPAASETVQYSLYLPLAVGP
jgi:Tol biopolymer transport system component